MTLSCMQGMGQLPRVREELQHPWIEPELLQLYIPPVLIPAAATRAHPSAGCWDRGVGDCPTVVLLWAERHNTGPLWED